MLFFLYFLQFSFIHYNWSSLFQTSTRELMSSQWLMPCGEVQRGQRVSGVSVYILTAHARRVNDSLCVTPQYL